MLTTLKHMQDAVDRLLDKITQVASAAADAINEVAQAKADKVKPVNLTIPTNGWKSDSTQSYPHYLDIAVAELTTDDTVELVIEPESADIALAAGMPCTESRAGVLRLRAKNVPTAAIKACYYIVM